MSVPIPTTEQVSRSITLIGMLCDARVTPQELAELDQLVVQYPLIRKSYIELMSLHGDLRQQAALLKPADSTESSALAAILDLIHPRKSGSSTGQPTAPEDSPASITNLNDTLILPAIAMDSMSELMVDDGAAIEPPMTITPLPVQKRYPWRIVAAVAVPLMTFSMFWIIHGRSNSTSSISLGPKHALIPQSSVVSGSGVTPSTVPSIAPSPQCIVNLAINAKWSDPQEPSPIPGAALNLGLHDLNSGMVKLELPGNAMVVVESPARFELLSTNKLRLIQGKICAQLVKGGGLTVITPDLTAVDLGTEFALDVSTGKQTHLEVFQGAVRAASSNATASQAPKNVFAGEAVMVADGSTAIQKDTPRPLAFLRPSQLQAGDGTSYQRWERFSQTIRDDAFLAAYYPFDAESAAADRLENRAKDTAGAFNAAMGAVGIANSHPKWVQGRWPGKSALQFGGPQLTAVTVDSPSEMIPKKALTICCWMRRDDLNKPAHILAGEAEGGRAFYLGFVTNEVGGFANRIVLTWAQHHVPSTPADFRLNKWEFVAVSSTVETGTQFYLDGKLVSVDGSRASSPVVVTQLTIGSPVPGNKLSNSHDYFNGSMDELLIFRRALSGEEIAHLFKIGSPN